MLPGIAVQLGLITHANLRSVDFVGRAASGTSTITIPTWVKPGDILIGFDRAQNSSGIPSEVWWDDYGFAWQTWRTGLNRRIHTYKKIAKHDDPGKVVVGLNGTAANNKLLWVFRANKPIYDTIHLSIKQSSITDGAPGNLSIAVGDSPSFVWAIYSTGASGAGNITRGFSPPKDGENSNSNGSMIIAWKFVASNPPSSFSISMNAAGNANHLVGGAFKLVL